MNEDELRLGEERWEERSVRKKEGRLKKGTEGESKNLTLERNKELGGVRKKIVKEGLWR